MFFIDLGKNGEEFGKTAVGDKLFGTVEDIVLAVFGQDRRGLRAQGVTA